MFSNWSIGHRGIATCACFALFIGLFATAARIVKKYQVAGPPDPYNEGYCDFHNGIYFPSSALIAGVSPYGAKYAAEYPVSRQIPFFSPAIVAFHSPLTFLPLRVAEILYFAIMVFLVIAIAAESIKAAGLEKRLDWLLVVAAGIVFSRAGHVTFFNGYFTFELVLAVILAIKWADSHPILAAMALVIVSAKPTYILPLGLLMLARGNVRTLIYGAVLSIAASAVPMAWLAWNEGAGNIPKGLTDIRQQITDAQVVHHHEPNEIPALSWTRIDIFAIVAKWTDQDPSDLSHLVMMIGILIVPMWLLHRWRTSAIDDGVGGMVGAMITTTMIVGLYRQSYDVLLLVPPIVGIIAGQINVWRELGRMKRFLIAVLMLFPCYNYLSTQMILGRFDLGVNMVKVVTSLNAIVMVVLLATICIVTLKNVNQRLRSMATLT